MKNKITWWNALKEAGMFKSQFRCLELVCLLGLLNVIPATAMDVQVVVDPDARGLTFAGGGHLFQSRKLSEV